MKKTELKKMLENVLPKNWRIGKIYNKDKEFVIQCPIEYRMNVSYETRRRHCRKIEKATGAKECGSGCAIGGPWYDIEFCWE